MINRIQKRLRFTPASSVHASDILRHPECQCDGGNLRMSWNSVVPARSAQRNTDIPRITPWNSWTLLPLLLFGWCFCGTSRGADAFVIPEITAKHYSPATPIRIFFILRVSLEFRTYSLFFYALDKHFSLIGIKIPYSN